MERIRHSSGVVIVVAAVALTAMTVAITVGSLSRDADSGLVLAGSRDELQERGVLYAGAARAYVVATDDGPVALYARSPHLGERVVFCGSSGWFEERRHGSMFDGLGRYVLGPAPRGLDRLDVSIVDGEVWVDTSNLIIGPPRGPRDTEPAGPFCRA